MGEFVVYIRIGDREYTFHKITIEVIEKDIENPFKHFNKKTIREIIDHRRYQSLKEHVQEYYPSILDKLAGEALFMLKEKGDNFYKQFLNNYGDLTYCQFVVKGNESILSKKGVYFIVMDNKLVFSGVCNNSFKLRFNQHIGNISPKCYFKDGTATHCHINARINENLPTANIYFKVCPLEDVEEMKILKNSIVDRFEPEWNLRYGRSFNY